VLRLTGAAEFADRRTNRLSGGQVQRVRYGVALVANARARPAVPRSGSASSVLRQLNARQRSGLPSAGGHRPC
jgi:hypothetical protein